MTDEVTTTVKLLSDADAADLLGSSGAHRMGHEQCLNIIASLRLSGVRLARVLIDTAPCQCGHPEYLHSHPANRVVDAPIGVAACVRCPSLISQGGCPEFREKEVGTPPDEPENAERADTPHS